MHGNIEICAVIILLYEKAKNAVSVNFWISIKVLKCWNLNFTQNCFFESDDLSALYFFQLFSKTFIKIKKRFS